jgi:FMN phosphatase YigB (HAD superfamily)
MASTEKQSLIPYSRTCRRHSKRIKASGVGIAIVSDHFDLRPEFAQLGFDRFVDHFVLSFEHGLQKPDPRMFTLALDLQGVHASETLMVGDRPVRDSGAVDVGISTLLLPTVSGMRRGLNSVLALVDSASAQ